MDLRRFVRTLCSAGLALFSCKAGPVFAFSDVGMVAPFITTACPSGWLPVNGGYVSPTIYPQLYNLLHLSSVWGNVGGNERLPNLGGNFIRGWEVSQSSDTARVYGSGQSDTVQFTSGTITPIVNGGSGNGLLNSPSGAFYLATSHSAANVSYSGTSTAGSLGFDNSRVNRTSFEERPINIALLFCVKHSSEIYSLGGGSMDLSSMTIVSVSTQAAADLTPGIFKEFTVGDLSFWMGVIMGLVVVWGYKAGSGK